MKKKIFNNLLFSIGGSVFLTAIAGWNWYLLLGLSVLFFCIASFAGDKEYNIMGYLPKTTKKIIKVVGLFVVATAFVACILFFCGSLAVLGGG